MLFIKPGGSSTKVILIQQKDNLLNQQKDREVSKKIERKNELKINRKINENNFNEQKKLENKKNLDTNSIDQKAKQFADFFNGEIVNLE